MSSPLKQNTNTIESILETINALPEQKGEPILQNKTVTPAATTQIVTADSDYDALNSVTVNGDANLVAANIAEGVSIFGVEGSHTGGVELPELTNPGSAADLLSGKELIDENGEVVTGTIATKTASDMTASGATVTVPAGYYASQATKSISTATQATPSISVSSAGLITASATQTAGYVAAGTKSGTKQLTTQAAKTITPSKSSQTAVASGRYTTGAVVVAAIPSKYVDVSSATASASDVMSGKTFGAGTAVKTGTFTLDSELTTQESLISQIATALEGKAAGGGGSSDMNVELCEIDITIEGSWGAYISDLIYSTIENSIIKTKYVSVEESFSADLDTSGNGIYSGTISCIIGTNIYLLDIDCRGPSSFATSGNITSNGTVGTYGTIYEYTVNGGSTGSITVNI